jgi:hypothetical protein
MKDHDWKKTYWQDLKGNRTTIQDVLQQLHGEPIVSLKIEDLIHAPGIDTSTPLRKEKAKLSIPIIVEEVNGRYRILDGHHRRQKAIDQNKKYILAKVFRGNLFKED